MGLHLLNRPHVLLSLNQATDRLPYLLDLLSVNLLLAEALCQHARVSLVLSNDSRCQYLSQVETLGNFICTALMGPPKANDAEMVLHLQLASGS